MVGRQLGGYAVSARIGVGGMGEVYRARDTRLQRDVAIKVLPRSLTSETEWVARFEREARILAALNHPNVAAIYGFEQWDDVHGLVLELVEGPTLEEWLSTQDLSVFDALTFARQIIEALDAAHEKGIVHRDLKPANIKIRTDGVVKVLDFGLAQTVARNGIAADLSEATTTIAHHTGESVILGTVPYMSPEQVRGQLVDKRSDIWAFGCVVYEMLTRRAPFKGETVSDTVAAILEREPNWSALPGAAPASVHRLLERCLEKDPKRRLRDIADALADIERPTPPLDVAAAPRRIGHTIERAALLALVVTLSLFGWWSMTRPLSREFLQLPMDLGSHVLDPGRGPTAAISPDGSRVVYLGKGQRGAVQLFVRSLNQDFAIPLAGTEGAASPFFSPDGHAVAFFAGNALKQVLLQGGRPVEICKVPSSRGGSWAEDGNIIAPLDAATPLYRIPSTGGGPQVLTALNEDRTHRWPHIVPGAAAVIFTASAVIGDFEGATIEIQSLKSNRRSTLVRGGYFGRYVPGGHLAYLSHGTLYAAPLDVERQELTGPAVPLIETCEHSSRTEGPS